MWSSEPRQPKQNLQVAFPLSQYVAVVENSASTFVLDLVLKIKNSLAGSLPRVNWRFVESGVFVEGFNQLPSTMDKKLFSDLHLGFAKRDSFIASCLFIGNVVIQSLRVLIIVARTACVTVLLLGFL